MTRTTLRFSAFALLLGLTLSLFMGPGTTSASAQPIGADPPEAATGSPYFSALYDHPVPPGILDGTPRTFVVTGYSTSLSPSPDTAWPALLQNMLDQHAGGPGTYYIYNEARGSTPLADWLGICEQENYLIGGVIEQYVDPATHPDIKKGPVPPASVMLAQQSLQYVYDCNDRWNEIEVGFGDLPGPEDQAKIDVGGQAFAEYAEQFLAGGIDRVYIATHIYAFYPPFELYGERFGMARALDLQPGLFPGPELWEVTRSLFPAGFTSDQRHPDTEVAHAMALYWYLVLAGAQAKPAVMLPIAEVAGVPIPGVQMETLTPRIHVPLLLFSH